MNDALCVLIDRPFGGDVKSGKIDKIDVKTGGHVSSIRSTLAISSYTFSSRDTLADLRNSSFHPDSSQVDIKYHVNGEEIISTQIIGKKA